MTWVPPLSSNNGTALQPIVIHLIKFDSFNVSLCPRPLSLYLLVFNFTFLPPSSMFHLPAVCKNTKKRSTLGVDEHEKKYLDVDPVAFLQSPFLDGGLG